MKHIQYTEAIQRSTGTGDGESVFPVSSVKDREKARNIRATAYKYTESIHSHGKSTTLNVSCPKIAIAS